MLPAAQRIVRARAYIEESNRHALETVFKMFAEDATYRSSQFGSFAGRPAIEAMMRTFFGKFPDVFWEVEAYTPLDDGDVEFSFTMTATDARSGAAVVRRGTERISFDVDGRISHVSVEIATGDG